MEENKKVDEAGRVGVQPPSVKDVLGKKTPEKKFKSGPVSATIWENTGRTEDGKETTFKTVSFERNYLDKDGNWKSTNNLRTGDLPKAILVLSKAYEYLALKDGASENE